MKRPLWCFGCVFAATMLLLFYVGLRLAVFLGILCLFLFVPVALIRALRRFPAVWTALLAVTLACIGFSFHRYAVVKPLTFSEEKEVSLTVQAEEISQQETSRLYRFRVLDGELPAGTQLKCYQRHTGTFTCAAWQTISGTFRVSTASSSYDNAHNIWLYATPLSVTVADTASRPWYAFFHDIRDYASRVLHHYLREDYAALAQAVCFGQRDLLSAEVKDAFSQTGVSHLLVTSGLHVSILAQVVLSLFKRAGFSRRKAAGISCFLVLLIMGLCGFGYSVIRAGIMQLILLLACLFRREADGLNSLGGALSLILFFQPYAVNDIGVWLSFGTTAGILFFTPLIFPYLSRVRSGVARRVLSSVSVTLSATLPVLPILAIYFHSLSLISPLSNLLIVFVSSPFLIVTYAAVGLSFIPGLGLLAEGLLFITGLLAKYLTEITALLARIPHACVTVSQPYLYLLLIGSLLVFWLFSYFEKSRGVLIGLLCGTAMFFSSFVIGTLLADVTTITAMNVGDATAVLLQRNAQSALLLSTDDPSSLEQTVTWLKQHRVTQLDFLLLPDREEADWRLAHTVVTESFPVERVLTANSLFEETQSLWNGLSVTENESGWLRISGDFSLLLIPYDITADAAVLPTDWRANHLLIFNRQVPLSIELLSAEQGVLCCDDAYVSYLYRALKDCPYAVDLNEADTVFEWNREMTLS